jgi:serine O-acetyltransferase
MTTFQLIGSDYRKYRKYGAHPLAIVFFTQGFWAIFQYRLANACYRRIRLQPFRAIALFFMLLWQKGIEMATGISVPASARIGHSFYFAHFGGIILNANVVIGDNCNVSQNVTIGVSGLGEKRGVPIIGNSVYIAANAVLAGKITIGDNAVVGACSLVSTDVPENAIVVGVPAAVVSQRSSKGYI